MNHEILYVIPLEHSTSETNSLFQGFSPGILRASHIFLKIYDLPANIIEPLLKREEIMALRMSGLFSYSILPTNKKVLLDITIPKTHPFVCIFSDKRTIEEVKLFIEKHEVPILHISLQKLKHSDSIEINNINKSHVVDHIAKIGNIIKKNLNDEQKRFFSEYRGLYNDELDINLNTRSHYSTIPNESALLSLKYSLKDNKSISPNGNRQYIEAIKESTNFIMNERRKILFPSLSNFIQYSNKYGILLTPSSLSLILEAPSMFSTLNLHKGDIKDLEENFIDAFKLFKRQKGYSIEVDSDKLDKIVNSKFGQIAISIRSRETYTHMVAVSSLTCGNFSPSIRLPYEINHLRADLLKLGQCVRATNKPQKVNKLMRTIKTKMHDVISPYLDIIQKSDGNIKILNDSPIEWLSVNGLPLIMKNNISRIPTTPGNLFFQLSINRTPVFLSISDFKEILIIRSFNESDRLKKILNIAINCLKRKIDDDDYKQIVSNLDPDDPIRKTIEKNISVKKYTEFNISYRWVDVFNEEDFINTLNGYTGAILIFDGHGSHDKNTQVGGLRINNKDFDIWKYKGKIRIPPVVILSACDTHPVDSSHASVANGFLVAGAKTVLGTLLPVDAIESAQFIARLMLRIKQYIPIALKKGPVRWIDIISGMQRMLYVTELLHSLEKKKVIIPTNKHQKILLKTNFLINPYRSDWYEKIILLICDEIGLCLSEIENFIEQHFQLPECMKYIQLGNPESIIINP